MTDPDCVETYQELAAILQNFQLGWVVEQVEASLSQDFSGHTEESPLPVATNSPQAVLTKPMTNTAQARLLKLIEATERMVVGTTEIEGALVDFLAEPGEGLDRPMSLRFADDEGTVSPPISVSPDRDEAASELRQLLQVLRQEVLAGVD